MGHLQRRLRHGIIHVVAHPKLTLLIAGVLLAASVVLALSRLRISSDENKLFSDKVKFFREFLEFDDKFPENDALYVVIEAKEPARAIPVSRWTGVADAITAKLRAMPGVVNSVDSRVPSEKMGSQGILFDQAARVRRSFEEFKEFTDLIKLWAEKPSLPLAVLGSTPTERFLSGLSLKLLAEKPKKDLFPFVELLAGSWLSTLNHPDQPLEAGKGLPDFASLDAEDPSRLGYYYVPDETDRSHHLLLVRIHPKVDYTSMTAISESVETIRVAINEAGQAFPEFKIGTTGRPALAADEMRITDRDSRNAEIVALSIVFVVMAFMLRSIWLALAAEMALAVGIGWTFGWATLTLGELNLLSLVFLIALIGIGMDYLVQILAAYRREARRRVRAQAIWARVFRSVGPPINTACLGAAGAFLVAALTDFRGAADLGIIAGGGLLLCLLAGYTVLPALLVLFPPKLQMIDAAERYSGPVAKVAGWRRFIPLAWMAALVAGIPFAVLTQFNPNLLDLQAPNLPSVKLIKKLQTWSAVVLSKDLKQLRDVRAAVQGSPFVGGTESILDAHDNYDWLKAHQRELPAIAWSEPNDVAPVDLKNIAQKARGLADRLDAGAPNSEAAADLRRFEDALVSGDPEKTATRLSAWQAAFIGELRGLVQQMTPPPLDEAKIPYELRSHLVSDDGEYALYILPKEDLWKRDRMEPFIRDVEARVARLPGGLSVTGIAPNIYHSTSSIEKSFYQATAYALALILILVLIDLRNIRQTLVAVSVLALGLPMLVALMGLFGIDWNFANFFGLPILIGAGHEYGVFLVHRYREAAADPRRAWRRWDASDRALLLCAFITSSSFGFFWALGHHRGLRSLGLVMALGTACIYLAAILVVRPLLIRELQRRALLSSATVRGKMTNDEIRIAN
jgi:predicted RND superfamily exporter protein